MNNMDLAIEILQDIFIKEALKWEEDRSYPKLKSLEKQTIQVFFWLIIPSTLRASYLVAFTDYQSFICEKYRKVDRIIEVQQLVNKDTIDLSALYQLIINLEFKIIEGEISYSINKSNRDNYGAYYTPVELANDMVKRATNESENINHKVIDFSCGTGIFLKVYAKHILTGHNISKRERKQLTKNLYGVDVDPIALLIAAYEISKITGYVPENLTIGNPLLINNTTTDLKRQQLFFSNLIYDEEMGLSNDFFDVKYDLVLGNPPWEKVRFEERKFFSASAPEISQITLKKDRRVCIDRLKTEDVQLYKYYENVKNSYIQFKDNVKKHRRLEASLNGELNTYSMFTELAYEMLSMNGVSSLIVKASLLKTQSNSKIVGKFSILGAMKEIQLFSNKKRIFSIDSREEFCVIYLVKDCCKSIRIRSNILEVNEIENIPLVNIKISDLSKVNPTNGLFPNFKTANELEFLTYMYRTNPIFSDVYTNVNFGRLVHLTNHSDNIYRDTDKERLSVYEGKFIEQYDTRFATFEGVSYEKRYKNKASAIKNHEDMIYKQVPKSRFFVDKEFWLKLSRNYNERYMLAWRSLTSITNRRTMISCILPFMPTSQSIQFLQIEDANDLVILNGLFNSVVFDYLVRLKMPGIDLTQSVIKDIPVPSKHVYKKMHEGKTLEKRLIELITMLYNYENRLDSLLSYSKETRVNRKAVIAEIDIIFAKAYGIDINELRNIAKTFPSFYSKEDIELYF